MGSTHLGYTLMSEEAANAFLERPALQLALIDALNEKKELLTALQVRNTELATVSAAYHAGEYSAVQEATALQAHMNAKLEKEATTHARMQAQLEKERSERLRLEIELEKVKQASIYISGQRESSKLEQELEHIKEGKILGGSDQRMGLNSAMHPHTLQQSDQPLAPTHPLDHSATEVIDSGDLHINVISSPLRMRLQQGEQHARTQDRLQLQPQQSGMPQPQPQPDLQPRHGPVQLQQPQGRPLPPQSPSQPAVPIQQQSLPLTEQVVQQQAFQRPPQHQESKGFTQPMAASNAFDLASSEDKERRLALISVLKEARFTAQMGESERERYEGRQRVQRLEAKLRQLEERVKKTSASIPSTEEAQGYMVPEGMNFIPLLPPPCSSATSASPCETRSVSVSQPVTPRPGLAEQARAVAAQMTLLPLEQRSSVPWTPPTPQPPKSPSTQPPFRPSRLQAPQSLQVAPHPPFHPAMGQVQQIMAHTPSGRAFPQWRMPQFAANAPLAYPGSSYSVPAQPLLAQQPAAPQMLSTFPQQQVWPQRQQHRFGEAQSVMPAPPPAHLRPPSRDSSSGRRRSSTRCSTRASR